MATSTKSRKPAAAAAKAKDLERGTLEKIIDKAASAVGDLIPGGRRDALDLLKEDHERVQKLFDQVRSTDEQRHPAIFERIKLELDVHAHIEETVFYPNLKSQGDKELVDMVLEGIEEHRQVKMFLKEIDALSGDSSKFEPKLKVLMEDVEHHVSEEEDEMFPLATDQLSPDVLEDLAVAMEKEKRKFKKSLAAAA
jgi:hemerythrin superfamily protein